MTASPFPFALRITMPRYDERDGLCGTESCLSEMRYCTVAGALAALLLSDGEPGEEYLEVWDTAAHEAVPRKDLLAARAKACGQNVGPRYFGANDKDSIPF